MIMIQGRSNWYDWVTGFHLYHSDDGRQWTGYSQSGDKNHSNVNKCLIYDSSFLMHYDIEVFLGLLNHTNAY